MDSAKIQLADKLKAANNILVTVSRNPSVDQLAACIGLSLLLNKFGKHAAAVFSGTVPSTIEFLKPEETLEKTTDSLRDFIIALDKSKADKLRYKVEDNVVRIFITPYRTSITQDDLEFSQGDFNVDVVVALGVHEQEDLDQAITMHGRILHDATVATINTTPDGALGSINWNDPGASSLSELVTDLSLVLDKDLLDNQTSTALLTGIVAETERFRNNKTTSETMRASAALMAAGADQQLVASQLEDGPSQAPADVGAPDSTAPANSPDGTLQIAHNGGDAPVEPDNLELPEPQDGPDNVEIPDDTPEVGFKESPRMVTEPPTLGGRLTANTSPEGLDPTTDPLSMMNRDASPLLKRYSDEPAEQKAAPVMPPSEQSSPDQSTAPGQIFTPPPPAWTPPQFSTPPSPPAAPPAVEPSQPETGGTLADLEAAVGRKPSESLNDARDEVSKALGSAPPAAEPIQALNAAPLGDNLRNNAPAPANQPVPPENAPANEHEVEMAALNLTGEPNLPEPNTPAPTEPKAPEVINPNAPPPVPPPFNPAQFSAPTPPSDPSKPT
jgi:hypothetical protein